MSTFLGLYNEFINELENASIPGHADTVREKWKGTPQLEAHQAVLGNFWDNPVVEANFAAIVRASGFAVSNPAMFANRFALNQQLRKAPQLTPPQLKTLDHFMAIAERDVVDSTKTFMLKIQNNVRLMQWADEIIESQCEVKGALVAYVLGKFNSSKHNLFAMYLVSILGNINDNADNLLNNRQIKEWIAKGLKPYGIKANKNDTQIKILIRLLPGWAERMPYTDPWVLAFKERWLKPVTSYHEKHEVSDYSLGA